MIPIRNRALAISLVLAEPVNGSPRPVINRRIATQMLRCLLLGLLVILLFRVEAFGQHHAKKGLQIGLKVGVSSYSGDIDVILPGENQYDLTYEGEAFYRFSRWFGLGVKQSIGKYPALATSGGQRHSTALAIRSYLLKKRISPYVQVGASRSSGGSEAGYGVALATGFELEVSRYISLYQDISFDQVLPDVALDGLSGGRKYDLFGRLGAGIRINFVRSGRGLRLATVEMPDSIMIGEVGEFQAVLGDGAPSDVRYKWDLPAGVAYTENPIRHSFANAGTYEMHLAITSNDELLRKSIFVKVYRPLVPDTVSTTEERQKRARIASVSADTELEVGAEGSFRMRIETGAEWPIQYDWDMGDGSVKVGNYVVHAFDQPGVYRVKGVARNAFGEDSREILIEVSRRTRAVAMDSVFTPPTAQAQTQTKPRDPLVRSAPERRTSRRVEDRPTETDTESNPASDTNLSVSDTKRTPVAPPNPDRNVSRIQLENGGYSWVVESLDTASGAATRAEDYKYLGFPYGYSRDPATGKYNVLVGQFDSEWVALKVSWRIQQHAPRRIWLSEVK